MKPGIEWLGRLFGWPRAARVAHAYRSRLNPDDQETRLILADLAHYCRAGHTSFVAGDPHQTAFNEGARDVFLHIVELSGLAPNDIPQLIEESLRD